MDDHDPVESPPTDGEPEGSKRANGEGDPGTRKPGSKAQGRKRTKTGCLTCRRRRIKCGEERPTCQNCTKSKRQCEGYNQRVVFKDPLNAYRGPPISISSQASFSHSSSAARQGQQSHQAASAAAGPLPIAPKPGPLEITLPTPGSTPVSALPSAASSGLGRGAFSFTNVTDYPPPPPPAPERPVPLNASQSSPYAGSDTVDRSRLPEPRSKQSPWEQTSHQYDFEAAHFGTEGRGKLPESPARTMSFDWTSGPSSASLSSSQELFHDSNSRFPASTTFFQSYPTSSTWHPTPSAPSSSSPESKGFSALPENSPRVPEARNLFEEVYPQSWQGQQPPPYAPEARDRVVGEDQNAPARVQYRAEEDEDDPYDVSDDDGAWQDGVLDNHLRNNDLGILVALQASQDTPNIRIRSITSFIDRPNMLATYIPSPHLSPLSDNMTSRIFCHFINVTGPSLSMFERHPANPSLVFHGQPVPKSQQHIWTYTFPTLAFHNQGLLHAILAVASLHIAKLQDQPVTASLKHYAIGLRRVAKSVSLPSRRGHPATLAAALLLAFYECWGADHQKWSNHIFGAKQLVREIDFAGMTSHIKSVKLQQRREEQARKYHALQQGLGGDFHEDRSRYQATIEDVGENIVSVLMGRKLRYDEYGRIMDDALPDDVGNRTYTQRELDIYETQRDLFWWYCKQDVYQSILGGGRLFMEYDFWIHCPPRAPLGRLNATYGTFDHLILLMGRLADFASKDLKRKRLAMKANGGWRPPGSIGMPTQMMPGQRDQSNAFHQTPPQLFQAPQMPPFSGMVPGVGPAQLPMGFEPTREEPAQTIQSTDLDLEALRVDAEEEWQEIRNAFNILEDHFGDDFQALGPEFSAPIQTPFGTALQYRTYGIAGIWMNFYMALIACHRAHPSMPPAAMMAAGIAARQTAAFANELGRIAAGIAPDCSSTVQVSPGVGAALIESATCLFVAGVQYQNAAQRAWTVSRLRDITRLTGWQTALAIAQGCEMSWLRNGEQGRGPPYSPTTHERMTPDWNSSRSTRLVAHRSSPTPHVMTMMPNGNNGNLQEGERRLVIASSQRVHCALGLLGVEEDFEKLDLDNDERPRG